jgi:hypothetical protein
MRYVIVLLLVAAALVNAGCDNFMVSGALNPSTFSGTVSIVRLSIGNDGTQITFVTLLSNMNAQDFTFCGNVVNQFPMNSTVQGSFMPGTACGTIVRVTISG